MREPQSVPRNESACTVDSPSQPRGFAVSISPFQKGGFEFSPLVLRLSKDPNLALLQQPRYTQGYNPPQAGLAQLVEQLICNQKVADSISAAGTNDVSSFDQRSPESPADTSKLGIFSSRFGRSWQLQSGGIWGHYQGHLRNSQKGCPQHAAHQYCNSKRQICR